MRQKMRRYRVSFLQPDNAHPDRHRVGFRFAALKPPLRRVAAKAAEATVFLSTNTASRSCDTPEASATRYEIAADMGRRGSKSNVKPTAPAVDRRSLRAFPPSSVQNGRR